jgi:hypothetical protein
MKINKKLETVVMTKKTQNRILSTFCASNFQSCKMALISSSSRCLSLISVKILLYSDSAADDFGWTSALELPDDSPPPSSMMSELLFSVAWKSSA